MANKAGKKNNAAYLKQSVLGVLIPFIYIISPLPRISKRPVRVSSNYNIRQRLSYPTKDHSRTLPRKCRHDATPSRGGHESGGKEKCIVNYYIYNSQWLSFFLVLKKLYNKKSLNFIYFQLHPLTLCQHDQLYHLF